MRRKEVQPEPPGPGETFSLQVSKKEPEEEEGEGRRRGAGWAGAGAEVVGEDESLWEAERRDGRRRQEDNTLKERHWRKINTTASNLNIDILP